jgi:3-deoxy-D-arabino-heptulosonate 7-phosphate (DAHP) synthase
MIVQMETGIREDDPQTQEVVRVAQELGLNPRIEVNKGAQYEVTEVHLLDGEVQTRTIPEHVFRLLTGVNDVRRVTPSRVSLAANGGAMAHQISLGSIEVGKGLPCQLIAGPCAVDQHIEELVERLVEDHGIKLIRGGCWKPRSQPDSFIGYGKEAVAWLLAAAKKYSVEAVFLEVMDETHLNDVSAICDQVGYQGVIVLWVGARTENQNLLVKLGRQTRFPVMLKNPLEGSFGDWIKRAEFVLAGENHYGPDGQLIVEKSLAQGNDQILLCSRGVAERGDGRVYRFDPHHHWIQIARQGFWPPVGVDPSHSAGTMKDDLVLTNLEAALIYKPDFVLLEVYFDSEKGYRPLVDGQQAVPLSRLHQVRAMITEHNRRHFPV